MPRRFEGEHIAHICKGYDRIKIMIAITPSTKHVQREVDLGRGE
jgi:hypothetical protein